MRRDQAHPYQPHCFCLACLDERERRTAAATGVLLCLPCKEEHGQNLVADQHGHPGLCDICGQSRTVAACRPRS